VDFLVEEDALLDRLHVDAHRHSEPPKDGALVQ
jgi:hypothetical protein